MRLKSLICDFVQHNVCTGVTWRGDSSIVTCGEDHTIRSFKPDVDRASIEERRLEYVVSQKRTLTEAS